MDIEGQGAVVVGGASGLGEATARRFAELGADVTILDINADRAADIAASVNGYSQHCDVAEEESVAVGITSAMARFGQAPRVVVNCAGLCVPARIIGPEGKVSTPIFRRHIEMNLLGTYHVMTYAAQGMMDLPPLDTGERGVIINTTSIASEDGKLVRLPIPRRKAVWRRCVCLRRTSSRNLGYVSWRLRRECSRHR